MIKEPSILKVGDTVFYFVDPWQRSDTSTVKKIFCRGVNAPVISVNIYSPFDVELENGIWVAGYKVRRIDKLKEVK